MNSYDLAEIWVRCKDKLKESFNEKVFNVWIKPIMPLEVTDTYYKVAVKNDFFKTMLEENYAQVIEGVLAGIMSKNIKAAADRKQLKKCRLYLPSANSSSCLMKIPPYSSPMKATSTPNTFLKPSLSATPTASPMRQRRQ